MTLVPLTYLDNGILINFIADEARLYERNKTIINARILILLQLFKNFPKQKDYFVRKVVFHISPLWLYTGTAR